jgi:hypothetical protein
VTTIPLSEQDMLNPYFNFVQCSRQSFDAVLYGGQDKIAVSLFKTFQIFLLTQELKFYDPFNGQMLWNIPFHSGVIQDIQLKSNDSIVFASKEHNFVYTWSINIKV